MEGYVCEIWKLLRVIVSGEFVCLYVGTTSAVCGKSGKEENFVGELRDNELLSCVATDNNLFDSREVNDWCV